MEPIYEVSFPITDLVADRYGAARVSALLYFAQEAAGQHCQLLNLSYEQLSQKRLFWAVIRHKLQITRLPRRGETIRVETWPMPTTRVAYPRSVVGFDSRGQECFRAISLWVLMDQDSRNMILPGKSGIVVSGTLRGTELASPASLPPALGAAAESRKVSFTDLDRNGHMNNTRYFDWIDDLLPSAFHAAHSPREITVCYLSEAREGEMLTLHCAQKGQKLQVDISREGSERTERVFSARIQYE